MQCDEGNRVAYLQQQLLFHVIAHGRHNQMNVWYSAKLT